MERTVLRILGKKGRTTIPWPIRAELEWSPGDVLLFESDPPDRVIITRMEVYEPEEVEEPDLTGGIFIEQVDRINNMAQWYEGGAVYQEVLISNYDTRKSAQAQLHLFEPAAEERKILWNGLY